MLTQPLGTTPQGTGVDRYWLRNSRGSRVALLAQGATVSELWLPDRHGRLEDVVLGLDRAEDYPSRSPYFGATIGRVAFRIPGARFELDGRSYSLAQTPDGRHLHGGPGGLSWVIWQAEPLESAEGPALRCSYRSPDGDQGYPGNLEVAVVYTLTEDNELKLDYTATTDRPTPVNLTHHSYFHLAGAGSGDVLDHIVWIDADRYSETDASLTPNGQLLPVAGTPWDLRRPVRLRERQAQTGGFDLAYLHNHPDQGLVRVARVQEPSSGRAMEVYSTAPAVIFYSGKWLPEHLEGKQGKLYGPQAGFCLETGHLPASVHHPDFPSTILRPGETYRQTCVYRFLTLP